MRGCGEEDTLVFSDNARLGNGAETGSESACIAMFSCEQAVRE